MIKQDNVNMLKRYYINLLSNEQHESYLIEITRQIDKKERTAIRNVIKGLQKEDDFDMDNYIHAVENYLRSIGILIDIETASFNIDY